MDNVINDIEFRAKDVIQKVWCYGFYSIGINPSSEWLEATIQTVNPDGTYGNKISIDRNTVGVWIGKKDKAGRKIFTGDILRMRLPIGYAVGYVMYDINGCTFVLHNDKDSWSCGIKGGMAAGVIGNLYDTPELLEAAA